MSVVLLNDHRPAVWYDIAVCHAWDGTVETYTKGIGGSADDRKKAADALRQAADGLEQPRDDD